MKFGQLLEYNMRTIFLKKPSQNVVQKLLLEPFYKKANKIEHIFGSVVWGFMQFVFILYAKLRAIKLYWN